MNWRVVVHLSVGKHIKRFPAKDIVKIEAALEQLASGPYSGDVQKMEGEVNVWRKRVGSYRIFYELSVEKQIVFAFRVERRASSTY